MDYLPDQLDCEILDKDNKTYDRNSVSQTCKHLNKLDCEQRKVIRVGCGLDPAGESLRGICSRFPYLEKVEIVYSGWMSKLGEQLDDQGLRVLSSNCPFLNDLTLSYCAFISDAGLSSLASCSNLVALRLNSAPKITGCGILSVVMGCKKLTVLHLIRCHNVRGAKPEWLEYLGNLETLEDLCIKNCRQIAEVDLTMLGSSWGKLKRLQFEVDANYEYRMIYDPLAIHRWQKQFIPCSSMLELSLVNCTMNPGRVLACAGLACVLGNCNNLQKVHLDMCLGLRDSDILCLAQKAKCLQSISLRLPSDLTDESLKALAENCSQLNSVRLSFSDGESSFTSDGIITLLQMCPIKELALDHVNCFDDFCMKALCSAKHLEILEIVGCQEVTDEGLQCLVQFPRLQVLRVSKCSRISDDGLKLLIGAGKLETFYVEDCPLISYPGVQGAAKFVTFREDLSFLYNISN